MPISLNCIESLINKQRYSRTNRHLSRELCAIRLPERGSLSENTTIRLRLADTANERTAASILINRMYSWRGYGKNHMLPCSNMHSTFTASSEDKVIGTITLGVDSPRGLNIDRIFADDLDVFRRAPGARLCELTKLAFDATVPSKPLLAAFFHVVFIYGQLKHQCTDLFIEVNPRHKRFYETMLGFRPIGQVKINEIVQAPSQLMWLKVTDIRDFVDKHAGKSESRKKTNLYEFFFSENEENAIYSSLNKQSGIMIRNSKASRIPSMIRSEVKRIAASVYRKQSKDVTQWHEKVSYQD